MAIEKQTKVKKRLTKLENNRWISMIILVGIVVIGLGNFTDAISKIAGLWKNRDRSSTESSQEREKSFTKQDVRSFLETVNPEILQRVDSGSNRIEVMMG